MHYQNQQRKKFKIKFQVLLKFAQILPDYIDDSFDAAYDNVTYCKKEVSMSQTTDQPTTPRGRDNHMPSRTQ